MFLVDPGLAQGRFYLEHLNAITCANAGCALILLCFARIILCKVNLTENNSGCLITYLGILIGSFIVVYSATRESIGQFSNYLFVSFIAYTSWLYRLNETKIFFAVSGWIFCIDPPHKHFASFGGEIVYATICYYCANTIKFWKISFEQFVANPSWELAFICKRFLKAGD